MFDTFLISVRVVMNCLVQSDFFHCGDAALAEGSKLSLTSFGRACTEEVASNLPSKKVGLPILQSL